MPNPVADYTTIYNLVLEQLSAAVAIYGTFSDAPLGNNPRWQLGAIQDWIVNADYQVAVAICNTDGHPSRGQYSKTVTLANQAAMPVDMIGPESGIIIACIDGSQRPGVPVSLDQLNQFLTAPNTTYGGSLYTDGHYARPGNRIFFSGQLLTLNYCGVSRGTAAINGLVSPPWALPTIVRLACVNPLIKEENYLNEGQIFDRDSQADLQVIHSGGVSVAPLEMLQIRGA